MAAKSRDYEIRIWYSSEPGDDCFVAQVSEMPGIMAHGETREEALRQIQAALDLGLSSYAEFGEKPPMPWSRAAAMLGRMGGRSRTKRKVHASRLNGRKGGRSRKRTASAT